MKNHDIGPASLYLFQKILPKLLEGDIRRVLCGHDNSMDSHGDTGSTIESVLDRDLKTIELVLSKANARCSSVADL